MRIEEAHINFGRLVKYEDKTDILENICNSNKDDKEFLQCGLLEPEILEDKPIYKKDKKEIEILYAMKTEPLDERFLDVPLENTGDVLATSNDLCNKDPLEKPFKAKKRKNETQCTGSSIPIAEVESIEIKKESSKKDTHDNTDDDEVMKSDDHSDLEHTSDNNDNHSDSDSERNMDNKIQKTYYKPRTKRKEHDQFIGKHFKDIICELCKTHFETFAVLRQHFTKAHKQKGYVICCNKKFFNRTRLVDHIHFHLNPDHLKCTKCSRIMSDSLHLERHMLRFHGATELKKKHCDVCQKPFIDGYSLRIHKLTHLPDDAKKFPCEDCGKLLVLLKKFVANALYILKNRFSFLVLLLLTFQKGTKKLCI